LVGEVHELTVERAAFGGDVIARAPDGRVVFLRGAAPGDRVRVRITQAKKRFLRAVRLELLAAGEGAEPFCPYFETCGGCPWMAIPRSVQRETLRAHVARALDVAVAGLEATLGHGWRSTARVHWQDGAVGFHAYGSDAVVDVEACPVLSPEVARLYADLRGRALRGRGTVRLTAAPGAEGGTVFVERGRLRLPRGRRLDVFDGVPHPAGSFVQAHRPGNARLVAAVVAALGDAERVLELYAGSGNFTFALAARGVAVTAVESDPSAVRALRDEARRRDFEVDVRRGDAAVPPASGHRVALVDPPRAGAREAVRALHQAGVARIAYVSCNPATLARDVDWLRPRGWRVSSARAFDLFPHTGHVEVLAVLDRVETGCMVPVNA